MDKRGFYALAGVLVTLAAGVVEAKSSETTDPALFVSPAACKGLGRKQTGGMTYLSRSGSLAEETFEVPVVQSDPPAPAETRFDAAKTITLLVKRSGPADDFETAAQRYERLRDMAGGRRSILISPRALNESCRQFKYDPEAGRLQLSQDLATTHGSAGRVLTLEIASFAGKPSTYIAQNSFGAKTEVSMTAMIRMFLRFDNVQFSSAYPELVDGFSLPTSEAREVLPRLLYRVTYEPKLSPTSPSWVKQEKMRIEPTYSEPTGGMILDEYLSTELVRIELLDPVTGRVYGNYLPADLMRPGVGS
jgi:hypothetical protein